MRKLLILVALMGCIAAAGCSKDAEVASFISEFDAVTKEMTTKLEAGDVAGAKKAFADKKASLQKGFDSFKSAREVQVSKETKANLEKSVMDNAKALSSAAMKAAMKSGGDKAKAEEIQALLKEFQGLFKM